MNGRGNSSPGIAQGRPGGAARDGPGHHRVRGWRPRTTRAKAGLSAVAAVGATGLAVTLAAGPAGASTKPVWSMTAGNVQSMSAMDAGTTSYFFNTSRSYGAGASLVKTPVQRRYATTPVLSYTSYARFSSDIGSGAIRYPYKWVMYDPENWSSTPVGERRNPVKYMALFGQLAHAHGLKVIQAPALDLAWVTGSVLPRHRGESGDQWYVRVNIAGKAAAAGDIYQLQDESNTTVKGQYAAAVQHDRESGPGRELEGPGVLRGLDRERDRGPDGHRGQVHQRGRLLCRGSREDCPGPPVLPADEDRRLLR